MATSKQNMPAVLFAGSASGVGKTTVVAGILAALRKRGLRVQPFKCGPDYIDGSYHTHAAGRPCRNLDSWMLNEEQVHKAFTRACEGSDIAIIEGVMGLFDGSDFTSERASAAQIAKLLGVPVVLVVDISGAARSAAANVLGFKLFDPGLEIAGVILNLAGSEAHARGCALAIETTTGVPVLGWLPKSHELGIPERHLGLVQQGETAAPDALVARIARVVEDNFDLDGILEKAGSASTVRPMADPVASGQSHAGRPVLAVARDDAFSFYYPDNLELLEAAGAQIRYFSPVGGEGLPPGTDGVYFGGGYPELHAGALSANEKLRQDLHNLHASSGPIYAECGGFMALTAALVDLEGRRWPMYGLVPGQARMNRTIAGLGYRTATLLDDTLLAPRGTTVRGHEFHYSTWEHDGLTPKHAWSLEGTSRTGKLIQDGHASKGLLASYLHVHFGQDVRLAESFVARMAAYRKNKKA